MLAKNAILLFLAFAQHSIAGEVRVLTTSGVVRGDVVRVLGQDIQQYLGIPYAYPPIGSLRFAKPRPLHRLFQVIQLTR